ncbi:hypothetical protein FACS189454_04790 [Planctomycetales bacterium]|nr:hypothetical protein FACS189454_04790 [Planctomycetales bacterium]
MKTLCELFQVQPQYFTQDNNPTSMREIDFYLSNGRKQFRCEVKLMGIGNPESADAIFARKSNVFIADKLSDTNKTQADELNIQWVELRAVGGYKRFEDVLSFYGIPFTSLNGDLGTELDRILDKLF